MSYDEDYEVPATPEDFGKCLFCGCMTLKGQEVCEECNSSQTAEYVQALREQTGRDFLF